MGCVYSKVEREEAVRRCRERRRLMKQLVECRARFAAAHLAYLQSLRNTGATLRQFAEADSFAVLPPGDATSTTTTTTNRRIRLPPPPPPLPPSPPPLPPFSPDPKATGEVEEEEARRPLTSGRGGRQEEDDDDEEEGDHREDTVGDESVNLDGFDADEIIHPPPPPPHGSSWGFWDPFDATSPSNSASPAPHKKDPQAVEDEDWAETKTEFDDEEEGGEDTAGPASAGPEASLNVVKLREKLLLPGRGEPLGDDNSSAVSSWFTKDTDAAVVVWSSKKTLPGIVRELDDYFLKAAAGGTRVAEVLESNRAGSLHRAFEQTKGKNLKSAKVFSSLSWRWSSRSPQSGTEAAQATGGGDRQSGSHCTTLDKLFAEEQKLYKEVKEEEMAKLQYRKKVLLLQKQEAREQDWTIIAKTQSSIEELQSEIMSLQESISNICMSISKLRDEELHLQLVELCSGLTKMWRTMYECHQVQNHIAQQVNHLHGLSSTEPTTDSHRHATAQLETEVDFWYGAFYNLLRAQRDYAQTLNQWVRLTDCLPTNGPLGASGIAVLCEEWELALERLPEKVAAEVIKSFVSVVHSIGLQLAEEHSLQKKSEHMERKLVKELNSLSEMERKLSRSNTDEMISTPILNDPPLSAKHAKMDAHKKRVDDEKSKYLNSVRLSRVMMINNLQTSLPNVFQALMGFSSVCVQAFEGIYRPYEASAGHANGSSSPSSEISQR